MLEKICELLTRRGLTQVALERAAGLPKNRISKWKDRIGEPTARQIWEISRHLGVSVEYLLDDSQERPARLLDEEEERVLWLVRELGIEQAKAILVGHLRLASRGSVAADPGQPGVSFGIGMGPVVSRRIGVQDAAAQGEDQPAEATRKKKRRT